jgi:hypothetical protein
MPSLTSAFSTIYVAWIEPNMNHTVSTTDEKHNGTTKQLFLFIPATAGLG